MNIEGRIRQLPLFAPPIDPALLVRARAAGLDLHDVISGARRLPHHRFQLLLPKALEFCAEVRSLGGALLSALEKVDAEKIALLRSGHEVLLFKRMRDVKQLQVDEAEKSLEALRASRPIAEARRAFYAENAAEYKTAGEEEHLDKLNQANNLNITAQSVRLGASIAHATPDFLVGTVTMKWGGSHVGHALNAAASVVELIATQLNFDANMASISASYDRRREDWLLQADLAAKECVQIDKQILTAEIRCDIARRDLANHEQQIAQAEEIKAFHEGKFTSAQLCNWMSGQIGALYFQAYKMAYELARMAEMAAEYELGLATGEMRIVQPGSSHWDSLRKGLLAGDRLHQDLRRLEMVYLERNSRTHEITKHVSLRQLNPLALMGLRGNGVCDFELPKALFDLDFPGHDRRRIKSVAISVPCVVGPYTSVSGTLTLVSHGSADAGVSYVPVSSIATSTGQNDSGVFELNFRDERYLPFEGADPVSSHWRFGLPQEFRTFDYDTISDVILHIRYTARDRTDGAAATVEELKGGFNQLHAAQGTRGLKLLISVKHDFPAEWRALQAETNDAATHPIAIGPTLFPFLVRGQFRMTDVRPVLTSGALGDNLMTGAAPRAGEPVAVNVTRQHRYLVGSYSLQ